ncbi:DUF6907 domain-containing protein [Streptomyces pristinaespiralis]|uniref:DUF6907 domain-containing protein n=1 Tax=Streptomyces pristinaespiralis TaxID=38300 RepID=UPI003836D851
MSITVPSNVKPSGGLVYPAIGELPAIPAQPKSKRAKKAPAADTLNLVAARVGRAGLVQTVYIECPTSWCAVDHLEWEGALEDISHYSDSDVVQLNTLTDDDTGHSEMYVGISMDPVASDPRLRAAHVMVTDAVGDAYLTPDMADEYADELIAFASQIREKARIARLSNKAGR